MTDLTKQTKKALLFKALRVNAPKYSVNASELIKILNTQDIDFGADVSETDMNALADQWLLEIVSNAENGQQMKIGDKTVNAADLMAKNSEDNGLFSYFSSDGLDKLGNVLGQFKEQPLLIPLYIFSAYAGFLAVKGLMRKTPLLSNFTGGIFKTMKTNLSNAGKLAKKGIDKL